HLLKARAHLGGDGSARKLNRENWRRAANEGDESGAQAVIVLRFRVVRFAHAAGERRQKPVAKKNSEEGSDERRGYLVANLGRRSAERSHRNHHSQHSGYDT